MIVEKRDISLSEYIDEFRDEERFIGMCRECGNYGNCWLCPPFEWNQLPDFDRFSRILLLSFTFQMNQDPVIQNVMLSVQNEREEIERHLLEMEDAAGGIAFGLSGFCPYCKECARRDGKKCRFPEKVRPPLEAFGFDLCRTMEVYFNRNLKWTSGKERRKELTLIGALLHNGDKSISWCAD